jgi:DNA-binding transcriptional LysR family regulator
MTKIVDWESRIGRRLRLRDLHVFFAVVQAGSMAKAAAHLSVTQPSVSKAIGDLEAALGVRLFDRSPQGVEPTMCGRALLRCGTVVFDELRQGIRNIEFLTDPTAGELKIACPESISPVLLLIFERFSAQYPRAALDVDEGNAPTFASKLRDRSLDLALVRLRGQAGADYEAIDDFDVETLFHDEVVVAAGMQSRWARRRKIDIAELIDERWILTSPDAWNYKIVSEAFRSRGLDMPGIRLKTFSIHLRANLLATGKYIAALPLSVLRLYADRFSLKMLPIDLPIRPWPVAIVTLKNRTLSPVVERFIECAREAAKSIASRPDSRPTHRKPKAP